MASMEPRFPEASCCDKYILVPENCHFLYEALKEECIDYGINPDDIYLSSARDRVVLIKNYFGVPAWALPWTHRAETDYEIEGPAKTGIHIDQGEESNWAELPNLCPESKWTAEEAEHRKREAKISARIRKLMDEAKELGMLRPDEKEPEYYDLIMPREDATAADLLERAELNCDENYEISKVQDILVDKGEATREKLVYIGMVMTTPDFLTEEELKAFRYDLACQIMRMLHAKWKPLEESIKKMKELKEMMQNPGA